MSIYFFIPILILGLLSYIVGISEIIKNKYSPNTFSRIIWVLLSINSFVGIILSGGSQASVLLGGIFLLGNIAICIASFWKGTQGFGKLEFFCLFLLLISAVIWIFYNTPLLNLSISLFAHFIGGIPTYKKVWLNPKSESVGFWSLFFFASLLGVFATDGISIRTAMFPIYFTLFDGSMTLLSLRKNKSL